MEDLPEFDKGMTSMNELFYEKHPKLADAISESERISGLESFSDYYYFPENFSEKFSEINNENFCLISLTPTYAAVIVTSCFAIIGTLLNCVVICVSALLKEYKKSWQHWLFLQILIANTTFLFLLFLQTLNELNEKWMMGIAMCKISYAVKFTGYAAGVVFLVILNISGIVSRTRLSEILSKLQSLEPKKFPQLLKPAFLLLIVWLPCTLVNIPLYKYSVVNEPCEQCALEFPIDVAEICPLLGWNITICYDMMNFFDEEKINVTDFIPTKADDYIDSSGDQLDMYFNNILDTNFTNIACKFDEPKSFYLWLFAISGLFYFAPIPILLIFCCLRIYDVRTRNNKTVKNKISHLTIIFAYDVMFFVFWTPWNIIHITKALGGIHGLEGYQCASLEHYARFSTLIYNTIASVLYAAMSENIRIRMMTSFTTSANMAMGLFKQKKKYTAELTVVIAGAPNGEINEKTNSTATIARNTSQPATFV